jgi:hypothetical protein
VLGSNFGSRTVSIAAPGLQILSTVPKLPAYKEERWYNLSGTSMATPLVAGVAALVVSILGSKDGSFYKVCAQHRTDVPYSAIRTRREPCVAGCGLRVTCLVVHVRVFHCGHSPRGCGLWGKRTCAVSGPRVKDGRLAPGDRRACIAS